MTPFPTYAPTGYQPNAPRPPQPGQRQMEAAIRRRAEYVHNSGASIYQWRGDDLLRADWSDEAMDYGSWWPITEGELPAGELVELGKDD